MKLKTTLLGKTYQFSSVKEVLAKANEEKSGDKLAGLAAASAQERVAAKVVLSALTLKDLRENPVVPYEQDEVTRIIQEDPQAKERLIEIWEETLNNGLRDLTTVLDENAELLQESQQLNFKRWKILGQRVHMNCQALGSYDSEVKYVKDFITKRIETFDELVRK